MNEKHTPIDFATVLAAAVHDMKNSLCLLQQSIEDLGAALPPDNPDTTALLASTHYEASRLNTGLVQLLSLYRAETENLPIHVDECFIEDLVDDLLDNNENYALHKNIKLEVDIDRQLTWYLDVDLVYLLLNDMLINAMRYCRHKILFTVKEQDHVLVIQVEDDGPGYPNRMLQANTVEMEDFDISQGRTGLGLFFARMIASAHTRKSEKGSIQLANGGKLGGSVFTLKLP